jgi:cysteinyl-tRNA synthetase
MALSFYNSLTRTKDEFLPLHPPAVKMYTCGVTVYDDCHIGHARSLFIFTVIRDYLKYRGYEVTLVRNITDIDDKIIARARESGVPWQQLVSTYIARYYEDMRALGIPAADVEPRATENIPEMIAYIGTLIERGFAYATGSGVYFNVRKSREYGKLSGQGVDQMLTGVRKESEESKADPLDFALWKSSKPGEPSWESPWGQGRPGWHIECSVMSQKYLATDTLDIHAGGRDLIFPHHENETAQAEACTGKPFAKYWIHHGLLTINGQKMSKSLGNFVTIRDFLARYGNADFLKLFFLSAHYASPIDYTEERIAESRQALERVSILYGKLAQRMSPACALPQPLADALARCRELFIEALDDDFNTPRALAVYFELVGFANKHLDEPGFAPAVKAVLDEFSGVLGFSARVSPQAEGADSWIEEMIAKRQAAKSRKEYQEADRIRGELAARGVVIEDSKDGTTTWRKKL